MSSLITYDGYKTYWNKNATGTSRVQQPLHELRYA